MRKTTTLTALVLVLPALVVAQAAIKVGSLTLKDVKTIGEIDTDQIKGQPSRVAWSPDGKELYVQVMDGQFGPTPPAKLTHLVYKVDGGDRREVQGEPEWLTDYWTAKSGQASPDSPAFRIDLKSESRVEQTVSTPMGGALARGGTDPGATGGDAASAAYNRQAVPVHTMNLHGQVVGEYVNSVIVPGQTFGWGPTGSKVIAYSAIKSGRLTVMDESGKRQEFEGTKDTVFPAWSPKADRIAWLEKDGRKKYILKVITIS